MRATRHAARRWGQRIGPAPCCYVAVRAEVLRSVALPRRAARELHLASRMREGRRVLLGARAVLVCAGGAVVTVARTTDDALAGALVYCMCGQWP